MIVPVVPARHVTCSTYLPRRNSQALMVALPDTTAQKHPTARTGEGNHLVAALFSRIARRPHLDDERSPWRVLPAPFDFATHNRHN